MKKKKYQLEGVLELRGRTKNEAAQVLLQKIRELESEQELLSICENNEQKTADELMKARSDVSNLIDKGSKASAIVAHKGFIASVEDQLEVCKHETRKQIAIVSDAELEVAAARETLMSASKELSVIKKHKEKWELGEKKRETKDEQKLLDEISGILHQRNKDI